MSLTSHRLTIIAALLLCATSSALRATELPAGLSPRVAELPLRFEPIEGEPAIYGVRGAGFAASVYPDEILVGLADRPRRSKSYRNQLDTGPAAPTTAVVAIRFEGASRNSRIQPADPLAAVSNSFVGPDASKWRTAIPNYATLRTAHLYPGIDLEVHSRQRQLEFDFIVAPGADPSQIAMSIDGHAAALLTQAGALDIRTSAGRLTLEPPVAWQDLPGGQRKPVVAGFDLQSDRRLAIRLGPYDPALPVTIDPRLTYSSYLGGTGTDEVTAIARDTAGNIYLCGNTTGDFPTKSGNYDRTFNGVTDAFVAKINPTISGANGLVFATYLGGTGTDEANGIVVDSSNRPIVTGFTASNSFPVTAIIGPQGGTDVFVTRVASNGGSLSYSAAIGGTANDYGIAIALDSSGNAYCTGLTGGSTFPAVNPIRLYVAFGDAFVFKLNSTGTALTYSTFLGGSAFDEGHGIAVDGDGGATVTGETDSTDFYLREPIQQIHGGITDAFLARVRSTGDQFTYSTYFGGSNYDTGNAVALDSGNNPVFVGETLSSNLDTENPTDNSYNGGNGDAFVARLNFSAVSLQFATYLGGDDQDRAFAVAIGSDDSIFVAGETRSDDFPSRNFSQEDRGGNFDAFLTRYMAAGSRLWASTFLGGTTADSAYGITLDSFNGAFLGGVTGGAFPLVTGGISYDTSFGGGASDGFLARLSPTMTTVQRDTFTSANIQPPGSPTGWSVFAEIPPIATADYDAGLRALRGIIQADDTRFRIAGFSSNAADWLRYSSIGPDNFVRVKYYIFRGGQASPSALNTIPNLRVRASLRFALNSMLEVFHHSNGDPGNQTLSQELRPSNNSARPSLYRVDLDPIDVPYLTANADVEGVLRAFEAYSIDPQDNGYIAMTESVMGVYPADNYSPLKAPDKVYQPGLLDAGDLRVINAATDLDIYNLVLSPTPGGFGERDTTSPQPTYAEGTFGVTLDSTNVPTDRVGIVSREFFPGASRTDPSYMRVEEAKQYTIRWHVTSTQFSNQNASLRLRARTGKFAWSQKLELGGPWGTGGTIPGPNNILAQQILPGIGCQNPDKDGVELGGYYTMIMHSPLSVDIRPDANGTLASRMPVFTSEPGPGVNQASRRDLRVGCDLVDTISGGLNAPLEKGNFTIDRIEIIRHDLADD